MNPISRRLQTSLKPALIHLSLSAAVALVSMAVIFGLWYPGELSVAQGVSRMVLIMIGVDVVVGPMITAIVFDPNKKGMRFDLMVIAALQTVALLYGMKAIYGGRPAYVVFNVDRFDVVALQDVDRDSLGRASAEFRPSFWKPRILAARLPEDPIERSDLLFSSIEGGADLPQLPEYFVAVEEERPTMLAEMRPMDELRKLNDLDDAEWRALLDGFGRDELELAYLPMLANSREGAVILDAKTGEILGIRVLTPRFGPLPEKQKEKDGATPADVPAAAPAA